MNKLQKYLYTCLLATAALFGGASPAWAQVSLGTASGFSVLGGTAVTCTDSVVAGDVGSGGAFTNTGCTVSGAQPPATNAAAVGALADFHGAYNAIQSMPCTNNSLISTATITGPMTLRPGVYCIGAALTGAGVLTLDARGNPNAVWIFKIGAALTGTGFSVIMANGGQACNVFWVPAADVTMTTSAFSGNILAGGATGSITMTGGTLAGRALASSAITMTGANVIGCAALPSVTSTCKDRKGHEHGKGVGQCDERDDHEKGQSKCNDGDDDDKGHDSGQSRYPFESKDKGGKK